MGKNQSNKETWATKIIAWSTVAVAAATIALVVVTWRYVGHTGKLIDMQRQQFELVNRAKIYPKLPKRIDGKHDKGTILFENRGNLSAENFSLIWKMIIAKDNKVERIYPPRIEKSILSQGENEKRSLEKVYPEEIIEIPYFSDFTTDDKFIFIVVAWRYKGQGIEGYMLKDMAYLWNTDKEPPEWGLPYRLDYEHVTAIDNIKTKLKKYLEQEENN